MSYDVYFADPETRETVDDGENYTSNVTPMLLKVLPSGLSGLHGKTGKAAAPLLRAAVERLRQESARFDAMNPPNGWGSRSGLVSFLERLIAKADMWPTLVVVVH